MQRSCSYTLRVHLVRKEHCVLSEITSAHRARRFCTLNTPATVLRGPMISVAGRRDTESARIFPSALDDTEHTPVTDLQGLMTVPDVREISLEIVDDVGQNTSICMTTSAVVTRMTRNKKPDSRPGSGILPPLFLLSGS